MKPKLHLYKKQLTLLATTPLVLHCSTESSLPFRE